MTMRKHIDLVETALRESLADAVADLEADLKRGASLEDAAAEIAPDYGIAPAQLVRGFMTLHGSVEKFLDASRNVASSISDALPGNTTPESKPKQSKAKPRKPFQEWWPEGLSHTTLKRQGSSFNPKNVTLLFGSKDGFIPAFTIKMVANGYTMYLGQDYVLFDPDYTLLDKLRKDLYIQPFQNRYHRFLDDDVRPDKYRIHENDVESVVEFMVQWAKTKKLNIRFSEDEQVDQSKHSKKRKRPIYGATGDHEIYVLINGEWTLFGKWIQKEKPGHLTVGRMEFTPIGRKLFQDYAAENPDYIKYFNLLSTNENPHRDFSSLAYVKFLTKLGLPYRLYRPEGYVDPKKTEK